jgi:integrase
MARKPLTHTAIEALQQPGTYAVGEVTGLYIQVSRHGEAITKSWLLRYMLAGRRREMGLGGFPSVKLSAAKELARTIRQEQLARGVDPIAARQAERSANLAALGRAVSFEQAARAFLKAHGGQWRNAKHKWQWSHTLETLAFPHLGKLNCGDITTTHVLKALEAGDLWATRTETASRLRGRIEQVLDYAKARGWRSGENPARWGGGNLEKLLANPRKLSNHGHMAAMAIDDMPAFMAQLRAAEGFGAKALEFAILTAARSGEVRGMTWAEIDKAVWTVPAARMKKGKEHRVPLSKAALALLADLPRMAGTDLVFPGAKGLPLSDRTLLAVLRRMGLDVTVHGFRSTFRDWAAERTNFPRELIEVALAHLVGDASEQAYWRSDVMTKRARIMQAWADFIGKPAAKGENIVPLSVA